MSREVLDRVLAQSVLSESSPESALEYLQSIYRNPAEPEHRRMRAAALALPFESPKLSATALFREDGFAIQLERAIARSNAQLSNGGKMIELKASATNGGEHQPRRRVS